MYNASERKDVKAFEKAARLAERQRVEVVRSLLSTAAGREYYLDKLESCHVFSTSFALNALQMAFNEGERNAGLQLLNDIMHYCPEQYVLMMQERNIRDATRDTASRRRAEAGLDGDAGEPGPDTEGTSGRAEDSDDSGRTVN